MTGKSPPSEFGKDSVVLMYDLVTWSEDPGKVRKVLDKVYKRRWLGVELYMLPSTLWTYKKVKELIEDLDVLVRPIAESYPSSSDRYANLYEEAEVLELDAILTTEYGEFLGLGWDLDREALTYLRKKSSHLPFESVE
ncbi:hypothetical protein Q7M76_04360 [Candidatus Liberibacter asiaticus]|uniref:hypothetical protein n=1 Tax=Liberibacter asiaticus TaxID=34021 RepID=UPI0004E07195|nr:hypothetical protein [Candidatus Liberibacter asiaticus]ALK07523.1 hypothetical protein CD16_04345 [Candidatus Liberibacter asiaticus]ASK53013.1 hypothetical protein B2I23_04410 [Candidatus Liberibacter asiaticus]AWL14337.1 hypothetical protein DIC79_04430 [Candidatus Liberibacter asiaticus]KAE9514122.1 hypothetical protein FXW25_04105 [Candidatus Liberibacter asiaticus]KAE9515177.1 hypothetical protein FXW26_04150 [Candidatus Liberibacter asiaticus]